MTAVVTLRCRALESRRNPNLLKDPMAEQCFDTLVSLMSEEEKKLLFHRKLSRLLMRHAAHRARKYDAIVNDHISKHASTVVVNLGCGFDTRYWRIDHDRCAYIEVDLPPVIKLKREILKGRLEYELIGCSVFDRSWIDKVVSRSNGNVLLLAEGLFMYLPKPEVKALFRVLSERLEDSRIVLSVVTERHVRGFWKWIVRARKKRHLGFSPDSFYQFGLKNALELESYGRGIKVSGEWSFVDDPDVRPKVLRYLGLSRTQWTVMATINHRPARKPSC